MIYKIKNKSNTSLEIMNKTIYPNTEFITRNLKPYKKMIYEGYLVIIEEKIEDTDQEQLTVLPKDKNRINTFNKRLVNKNINQKINKFIINNEKNNLQKNNFSISNRILKNTKYSTIDYNIVVPNNNLNNQSFEINKKKLVELSEDNNPTNLIVTDTSTNLFMTKEIPLKNTDTNINLSNSELKSAQINNSFDNDTALTKNKLSEQTLSELESVQSFTSDKKNIQNNIKTNNSIKKDNLNNDVTLNNSVLDKNIFIENNDSIKNTNLIKDNNLTKNINSINIQNDPSASDNNFLNSDIINQLIQDNIQNYINNLSSTNSDIINTFKQTLKEQTNNILNEQIKIIQDKIKQIEIKPIEIKSNEIELNKIRSIYDENNINLQKIDKEKDKNEILLSLFHFYLDRKLNEQDLINIKKFYTTIGITKNIDIKLKDEINKASSYEELITILLNTIYPALFI